MFDDLKDDSLDRKLVSDVDSALVLEHGILPLNIQFVLNCLKSFFWISKYVSPDNK